MVRVCVPVWVTVAWYGCSGCLQSGPFGRAEYVVGIVQASDSASQFFHSFIVLVFFLHFFQFLRVDVSSTGEVSEGGISRLLLLFLFFAHQGLFCFLCVGNVLGVDVLVLVWKHIDLVQFELMPVRLFEFQSFPILRIFLSLHFGHFFRCCQWVSSHFLKVGNLLRRAVLEVCHDGGHFLGVTTGE
uniref:Uncharacterized protein n=1 Tax=Cacopsylla melanoneura TaxID=428564 RepID=A0A8D8R7P4_9HEMI